MTEALYRDQANRLYDEYIERARTWQPHTPDYAIPNRETFVALWVDLAKHGLVRLDPEDGTTTRLISQTKP